MLRANPYEPVEAVIRDSLPETPNIRTLVLEPVQPLGFQAGQFVQLRVPGMGEAPFTVSSSPHSGGNTVHVTIMRTGRVSEGLHLLGPGSRIGVRGPLGNGYPLDEFKGKDVLVVGGGVGMAPLRSLVFSLLHGRGDYKDVVLCYGARTPQDIVYRGLLDEWSRRDDLDVRLTVDVGGAGWTGRVGVVTSLLDDTLALDRDCAVVCGPPIMMRFATLRLLELGYSPDDIYLSMEKNMSCGIGKCGHCMIGPYYVCAEGPVFRYSHLSKHYDIFD